MTGEIFFRRALLVPLVVPILLSALGVMLRGGAAVVAVIALGTLVYAGIPYMVFALAMYYWTRNRPVRTIRRAALLSPLLFAPLAGLGMALFFRIVDGSPTEWRQFAGTLVEGALLAVFFGYAYVLVVFAADRLRRAPRYSPEEIAAVRARDRST